MVNAIIKEIRLIGKGEQIETVYFGGGTPSLLLPEELSAIMKALHSTFTISRDAEITLEANPDDIDTGFLQALKANGINRLSVGLQSFDEDELRRMNRAHTAGQSLQCLADIRAAGFGNFSVDLIYGSPLQTVEILRKNFEIITSHAVPHISCYALTVEEGTLLHKKIREKTAPDINADHQSEHFHLLLQLMEAAGYEQYEISNFCKPGFRSRHNSSYWQGRPYFGFGPSAHSFDGARVRKWNPANNSLYLQSLEKDSVPSEEEMLTDDQRLNEYVMTSLRTSAGLDLAFVKETFGEKNAERIEKDAEKYIGFERMMRVADVLMLTTEGKFFADGIAADLFA